MSFRTLLRLLSQRARVADQTAGSVMAIWMSGSAILVAGASKPLAKIASAACRGVGAHKARARAARRWEWVMATGFLFGEKSGVEQPFTSTCFDVELRHAAWGFPGAA